MATTTSVLGLTKPAYSEAADVSVLNSDMDLIDAEAGRVRSNIAANYSASSAYAVGDLCLYTGVLYRCKTAIGSGGEAWNSGHWDAVKIAGQLSALSDQIATFTDINEIRGTIGGGGNDITSTSHVICTLTYTSTVAGLILFNAEGTANLTANEVMCFSLYDGNTELAKYGTSNIQGKQWIATSGHYKTSSGTHTIKIVLTTFGGNTNITIPAYNMMCGTICFIPFKKYS